MVIYLIVDLLLEFYEDWSNFCFLVFPSSMATKCLVWCMVYIISLNMFVEQE